jgi:hypothetical protein
MMDLSNTPDKTAPTGTPETVVKQETGSPYKNATDRDNERKADITQVKQDDPFALQLACHKLSQEDAHFLGLQYTAAQLLAAAEGTKSAEGGSGGMGPLGPNPAPTGGDGGAPQSVTHDDPVEEGVEYTETHLQRASDLMDLLASKQEME